MMIFCHLLSSRMPRFLYSELPLEYTSSSVTGDYTSTGFLIADVGKTARIYIYNIYYILTSSTAQGGGGSFKKRKTIGEIGCCESRMSKQKH